MGQNHFYVFYYTSLEITNLTFPEFFGSVAIFGETHF